LGLVTWTASIDICAYVVDLNGESWEIGFTLGDRHKSRIKTRKRAGADGSQGAAGLDVNPLELSTAERKKRIYTQ